MEIDMKNAVAVQINGVVHNIEPGTVTTQVWFAGSMRPVGERTLFKNRSGEWVLVQDSRVDAILFSDAVEHKKYN